MIKHIVMFKFKNKTQYGSSEDIATKVKEQLLSLQNIIEELQAMDVGINFNLSDAAYDLVLDASFYTRPDLETYQNHPAHLKISSFINEVIENRVVVDFEN